MSPKSCAKRDVLAAVGPFAELTLAQLDQIAQISDERHVQAGGTLCCQGDFGVDAFVIAQGRVSVVIDGIEVAERGPGEIVGDWALFTTGHRSATLRAASPVDVVVLDAREIDSVLMAVPTAAGVLGPQLLDAAH